MPGSDAPAGASAAVQATPPPPSAAAAAAASFTSPVTVLTVDEAQYETQLDAKVAKLRELFHEFEPPALEVFRSPPSHYRMRAEFTIEQRDGDLHYVMFEREGSKGNNSGEGGSEANASGSADADGGGAAAAAPDAATDAAAAPSTSAPTAAAVAAGAGRPGAKRDASGAPRGRAAPKGPKRVRVDSFPVASRQVNELMAVVRQECGRSAVLRERLFQVNFHTTLAGDSMVTLLYHRKLGPDWQAAVEVLRDALAATPTAAAAGRRPHVIGRSRKQALYHDEGFVLERLTVNGRSYVQKQVEAAFSQPNGAVCQHMLSWAQDVTRPAPQAAAAAASPAPAGEPGLAASAGEPQDDLLELYCGNGNFTVPLAANFRRVVATEVAKSSVEAARYNLEANGVANVFLARMASEEFAETMRERGTRRRLAELGSWDELRLHTVLVDPPRAGLDEFTVQLLKEFDRIVYISCNPETLHANLRALAPTHRVARFAAFDQFPYTHHLECGVYLTRR